MLPKFCVPVGTVVLLMDSRPGARSLFTSFMAQMPLQFVFADLKKTDKATYYNFNYTSGVTAVVDFRDVHIVWD